MRGGNKLKTPKFHQMLHVVDYVERHGCLMNYDGSRGENIGKTKIKDNDKRTNQQKHTLQYDIGKRISEDNIVDHISNSFHQRKGCWPSKFCNETDLLIDGNNDKRYQCSTNGSSFRHRFTFTCDYLDIDDNSAQPQEVNIKIDWGGIKITIEELPTISN